jgi:hypothetical protein
MTTMRRLRLDLPIRAPRGALVLTLALVGAVFGCDEDDGDGTDDGGDDTNPPLADIVVDVSYAGSELGQLTVGAFEVCPPEIAPVSYTRVVDPVYPSQTTLRNLEPGTYCVVGFIDLEPLNPTFPGPEDPYGEQLGVVVDGSDVEAALTIVDP